VLAATISESGTRQEPVAAVRRLGIGHARRRLRDPDGRRAVGIEDCFLAVDELKIEDGALVIKERVEGGLHQVRRCAGPPAALAWPPATCPNREPSPDRMANMRAMMPALQRAKAAGLKGEGFAVTRPACRPSSARRKSSKISPPRRSPANCSNGSRAER